MYAYPQLDWDPEPVLQAYSAYTSYLDRLDAAFLASARAPERILYQPWMVIDGRDTFLDPPATVESLYCHYLQLPAPGPAQVLARVANRCGQPVEVERASAHFGVSRCGAEQTGRNGHRPLSRSVPRWAPGWRASC